jgi:periplasmic copper chaperone A
MTLKFFLSLLVLLVAPLMIIGPALACEDCKLEIKQPYAFSAPASATAGAAFLTIYNGGHDDDALIAVSSDIASKAELHTHSEKDGVMSMRAIDSVPVAAGKEAILKPMGDHIMLIGLKKPLKQGEMISMKLAFKKAGERDITVPVLPVGQVPQVPIDTKTEKHVH